MALPTSTFVMGVAVAGVLALAIRGTVEHEKVATPEEREEAALLAALDAEAAQQAQIAAQEDAGRQQTAKREKLLGWTRRLVGAEVATFGGPLAGVSLPVARAQVSAIARGVDASGRARVEQTSLGGSETIDGVELVLEGSRDDRRAACDALARELHDAWGAGTELAIDRRIWLNAPRRQRAMFFGSGDMCSLTFDHVLAPDAWLAAIPLVGQRRDQLPAWTRSNRDGSTLLAGPGVGIGAGPTGIYLKLEADKVAGVRAIVTTDDATRAAIARQLAGQRDVKLERAGWILTVTRGDVP